MRILKSNPYLSLFNSFLVDSPLPANINYFYGFGSLLGLVFVIQLITGIFLAMHYTPNIEYAFNSVEHIMRDVNYGWLIRYAHANGASFFFLCVYIHVARGLYYGSFNKPRVELWSVGVTIFIAMMATAFLGYVLPWGQMSFWAACVITNFFSAIPYLGPDLVEFIWGSFSVDNPTLNRFFSLHYLLPFIIAALVVLHLIALHLHASNNPLGLNSNIDKIPFHPYFTSKDLVGFLIFGIIFSYFIFFQPNLLGHPDNYIPANPLVTPTHIVPEWYSLLSIMFPVASTPDPKSTLSNNNSHVLVGLLLGDANLQRRSRTSNTRLHFTQSEKHFYFFINVFNIFKSFCNLPEDNLNFIPQPKIKIVKGISYKIYTFTTLQLPCFNFYYEMFYPNGKKIVPGNIDVYLSPITLAYWIMCDGSLQNQGIHLNTYGFNLNDNKILVNALNKNFNIQCTIHNHKSGFRIYINKADFSSIKHLLLPHMDPSMLYKFPSP